MRYAAIIIMITVAGCANGPRAYLDVATEWNGAHYGVVETGVFVPDSGAYIYGAHRSCIPCRAGFPLDHNAVGIGYRTEWGGE